MWDLNLVWLQTSLNHVWFESCQCLDECYHKNKNLFKELFVCLFKRLLLPNVKKVGALWAVTSFPSSPDVLLELRILSTWFLPCFIPAEQGLHFWWIMWQFLIRMDGEQRLRLDFCADVTLLQVCHSGAAYWVSDPSQGDWVSKWQKLRDRRFHKVPCAEEQQTMLPAKVLDWMQWFPIPSLGFWLCCQTGLFPGSGFCDWLHYFVFHKPNPSSCVFIGAFLPGRAILWFTHSPAKLLQSMNFQCSKDLCVVSSLLGSVRSQSSLFLLLPSSLGESWAESNLLACSAPWSAPPSHIWDSVERASGVQEEIFD